MSRHESEAIRLRVARIEERTGKQVTLRGLQSADARFRGSVSERSGCIVVEYRDDGVGCFWRYGIIEKLLDHVERGCRNVVLHEGECADADAASDP